MRDWRGITAIVLAAGVSLALVAGTVGAVLQESTISQQGAAYLSTLGGAAIGAVAGYLGARHTNGDTDE